MAALNRKKIRLERESESVLTAFRSKEDTLSKFKQVVHGLELQNSALCMIKIANCNGSSGCSFSDIFCETKRNIETENEKSLFAFKTIFKKGWKLLNAFIEDSSFESSEQMQNLLLSKLLSFLLNYKDSEDCLNIGRMDNSKTKHEWCQIVTHHYLSKLAMCSDYIMDNHYTGRSGFCPGCGQLLKGAHGNTSIGNKKTWHGYVNILLGSSSVPVISIQEPVVPDGKVERNGDGASLKRGRKQMIAQTIVFSFLQMKHHSEYTNFLIPAICVYRQHIVFFFYDAVHDILLESPPRYFFKSDNTLNLSTVIETWLVLNYKFFCSGVTRKMLEIKYTCDFPVFAGEKFELYKNQLDYGCCVLDIEEIFFKPWKMDTFKLWDSD